MTFTILFTKVFDANAFWPTCFGLGADANADHSSWRTPQMQSLFVINSSLSMLFFCLGSASCYGACYYFSLGCQAQSMTYSSASGYSSFYGNLVQRSTTPSMCIQSFREQHNHPRLGQTGFFIFEQPETYSPVASCGAQQSLQFEEMAKMDAL